MAAESQWADLQRLGPDVEMVIFECLDLISVQCLALCTQSLYAAYMTNLEHLLSRFVFRFIESRHLKRYEFEIRPLSSLDVHRLYCMFQRCQLPPIQRSWFRIGTFSVLKQNLDPFDRYDVSLNKYIKSAHLQFTTQETHHSEQTVLYCNRWKAIRIMDNGSIDISIRDQQSVRMPGQIDWKYTPSSLVELKLRDCNLLFDSKQMFQIPVLNELVQFDLRGNAIFGDCQVLSHFARFPKLEVIVLDNNKLSAINLSHLPSHKMKRNTKVRRVSLKHNQLRNNDDQQLVADIRSFHALFPKAAARISGISLTDNQLNGTLDLVMCDNTDRAVESWALRCDQNRFDALCCRCDLSKLQSDAFNLKALYLSQNMLSGDIMKDIVRILPASLERLDLSDNQIAGILDFDTIGLRLPKLQKLLLHYNAISGIKENVNEHTHWPLQLAILDLSHNQIKCSWDALQWNRLCANEDMKAHSIRIYLNDNQFYGEFNVNNVISYCTVSVLNVCNNSFDFGNLEDASTIPSNIQIF